MLSCDVSPVARQRVAVVCPDSNVKDGEKRKKCAMIKYVLLKGITPNQISTDMRCFKR